jgi:hypothetical protein
MRLFSPVHLAFLTLAAGLAVSGPAAAQVHWDAGAQVGVVQRLETGLSAGAPGPIPGPVGELHAHVAIVPMLRVGPYVSYDISPFPPSAEVPARQIAEGGVRAKFAPPLLTGSWHLWALLGIGYAYAYLPSHGANGVSVAGVEGTILDLPVGIGVGYRMRGPRDPWELTAELAGRVGLAFFGAMYSDAPRDSFALSLSVGVSLEE